MSKSIKALKLQVAKNRKAVSVASAAIIQAASNNRNATSGAALQEAYATYDAAYEKYRTSLADLIIAEDEAARSC